MKIVDKCQELVAIDSPSGFGKNAIEYLVNFAAEHNFKHEVTSKGNVLIHAEVDGKPATKFVATHVDTLGLMVRSINDDGTLNVTLIGSPIPSTLNGEYVKVYTRDGEVYEGTVLLDSNSKHVFADSGKQVEVEDLRIRLDNKVNSKEDVRKLGIEHGDFVCYDPKFRYTNGFINSRFLDDKLCAAISLEMLEQIASHKLKLKRSVTFGFTCFEEVGHGLSYVPANIKHVIALDMGCVGDDLVGNEYKVSICAKDSSGPYDYDQITKMVNICKAEEIDYGIDVYPFYGSDASAALRGGNDIKASLIGPGIAASHGMERAHIDGVRGTYKLLAKLLCQ